MSRNAGKPRPIIIKPAETPEVGSKAAAPAAAKTPPDKPKESFRDFLEQVIVAIILAVLVRGFNAEAFVIPTGSMAPGLMGMHKEITCPNCGFTYAVNSSEDIEAFFAQRLDRKADGLKPQGVCANCRYKADASELPTFKGDRILVMKFPFEMPFLPGASGPRRWDVVVFHYPNQPETNFIKRLIGLPGEQIRIFRGDVQARNASGNDPFQVQRKPLKHLQAMLINVYDDRNRPKTLEDHPEWHRWRTGGPWREETPGIFTAAPAGKDAGEWTELQYHNLIPDPEQWAALESHRDLPRAPRSTLITDFYGYNTNVSPRGGDRWLAENEAWFQANWVGDLHLSSRIRVVEPTGLVRLQLVESGVPYRCEIDLATGQATLYQGEKSLGQAQTAMKAAGSYDVAFSNVDDRLTLWVDGKTPFGDGVAYENSPDANYGPAREDLQPATVASKGASIKVSDLVLKRDIYYTQEPKFDSQADVTVPGISSWSDPQEKRVSIMFDFLADPAQFRRMGEIDHRTAPYEIKPDHYMMLGDNSPRSSDSRAWGTQDHAWLPDGDREPWEVPKEMLIGKAFFIYWPHGKPFGPDIRLGRDFRIPFRPYFERMMLIR